VAGEDGRVTEPSPAPRHEAEAIVTASSFVPAPVPDTATMLVNAGIGAGASLVGGLLRLAEGAAHSAAPVVRFALNPPLLPDRVAPARLVTRLSQRGDAVRHGVRAEIDDVSRELMPTVADAFVERMDVTDLVLERVDLVRIVEAVLDGIDLTELVLQRVDLDRIVTAVLDRIDLTELVLQRVDLDRIIASVDLDAAASGLDVDAVALRLDVDAVAARMDLVGIAEYIVDAIDLSEIIRNSTGSVAGEAVRGARLQSIEADEQLQRVVDRLLLRRRQRRTDAPGDLGEVQE
jgi:hypothetical protein